MNWNCSLFCGEQKSKELRGRVKASSKEKTDKKELTIKLKKLPRKLHRSSIILINKICFRWKCSIVIIIN